MKRRFTKHPTNIIASTRPHPKIPVGWERIPEGDDDDGNWGTIAKALPNNQGYYWINIIEDEQGRRCFELEVGYRGSDGSIGKIWKVSSKPFYRLSDIVTYADTKWKQLQNEYDEDIDACDKVTASTHRYSVGCIEEDGTEDFYYDTGFDSYDEACDWGINHECTHIYDREKDEFTPINSCDTKYFANMVNASDEVNNYIPDYRSSEDTHRYLVKGYYDSNKRGLADSSWADTVSEVDEIVNEYANKGYYLEVRNLETGTVLEFSADNWFDEIYPDGGFSAIPGAID